MNTAEFFTFLQHLLPKPLTEAPNPWMYADDKLEALML